MADQALRTVRVQFIESINESEIGQLLDDLYQRKVFTEEESDEVKVKAKKQDKARVLIDHVTRKGHNASKFFIERLQCRFPFLVENLGLQASAPAIGCLEEENSCFLKSSQPLECKNGIKLCPLSLFQEKQKNKEIYPIIDAKTRTRLALIICNIEFEHLSKREGAEVDVREMTLLLEGLGYQVEVKPDLCTEDMAKCLKNFAARAEHERSDSTFVVLMSHGNQKGLCGTNTDPKHPEMLSMDTVVAAFNNRNCKALRGKPKVIVVQACRGENRGYFYTSDSALPPSSSQDIPKGLEEDSVKKMPVESDFLCLHATTPDTVAWRDKENGSVFIIRLIESIKNHAWNCNLEEVFQKVMRTFEDNPCQMPSKDRTTLTKQFFLFPGH